MAEALRKNIYIPEEEVEFFKECEKFTQDNNMPMSGVIIQALKKYMEDANNSDIILVVKKNEESVLLNEYKKIKFKGKKIVSTGLLYTDKCPSFVKLRPKFEMYANDNLAHEYIFYKTEKGMLLAYIRKLHVRFTPYSTDTSIIEEECMYEIFKSIEDAVSKLNDIPNECIDELILEMADTEELDI